MSICRSLDKIMKLINKIKKLKNVDLILPIFTIFFLEKPDYKLKQGIFISVFD